MTLQRDDSSDLDVNQQLLRFSTTDFVPPPLKDFASIHSLPPELLRYIQLLAYYEHSAKFRTKFSLTLSWVCRRWRDLSHDNMRLWTEISFSDPHLALFCLNKSKDALIRFSLEHNHFFLSNWEYEQMRPSLDRTHCIDLVTLLKENACRTSHISMSITDHFHPSLTSYALNVLESLLADKLTSLTIQMQLLPVDLSVWRFKGKFPSLRSLSLDHYLPMSTSPFWDTLPELEELAIATLSSPSSTMEYHSILGKLPSLKCLRISTGTSRYFRAMEIKSFPALPLLRLKDCYLELELITIRTLLPSMIMQNLERFDLKVSPTSITFQLEQLMGCLQFSALLENIQVLRISMWSTGGFAEPIAECLLEGWQRLKEQPIFKLECKRVTSITGILKVFKHIQELYIFGGRYPGGDMGQLPQVTTLHLRQTDIRILLEFYLYETVHHLQTLNLHDMMLDGRSDLICNFRHIRRLKLTQCSGVSENDMAKFKSKGLVVDVKDENQ